jgi:hypothetical protein
MNFLFLTQSKTLSVFFDLEKTIRKTIPVGKTAFYISDSIFFYQYAKQNPEITSDTYELLKEWEIVAAAKRIQPDLSKLRAYENKYGDPVLWNALVADRRIYLGKKATLEQDYASRFDHQQMLAILQKGIEEMEGLFERVRPNAVVGFICVTIGEYLAYLIAKAKGVPLFNLRPTRIKNLFHAGESVLEPSMRLQELYQQMLKNGIPNGLKNEVSDYLKQVRETHAMYEGVIPAGTISYKEKKPYISPKKAFLQKLQTFKKLGLEFFLYNFGEYRHDNSHRGVLYSMWFHKIKQPIRIRYLEWNLRRYYLKAQEISSMEYAFFPLHKEPEVTLLVYSRPYMNQIEVIRSVARSLPVGMKLVVKEHPAAVGYRPLSYYKKILAIPGVVLVAPRMESRSLIEKALLIVVISGSIGLEALMMKKPVIHFGRVPFGMLPDTMLRGIRGLETLGKEIKDLLHNHIHNEQALIAYVASVMKTSVPIDFYSVLLGRESVYRPGDSDNGYETRNRHIDNLRRYLLQSFS